MGNNEIDKQKYTPGESLVQRIRLLEQKFNTDLDSYVDRKLNGVSEEVLDLQYVVPSQEFGQVYVLPPDVFVQISNN